MSLVDLGSPFAFPLFSYGTSNFFQFASSQYRIDASGEKVAQVFNITKTGSITKVWFRTAGVTTGGTLDIRLETVSTTDGTPTGTLLATNTNVTQAIASTDDNLVFKVTLTAAASVTAGNQIALVIADSVTGDIYITGGMNHPSYTSHSSYGLQYASAAWGKSVVSINVAFAIEYSDGTIISPPGCMLCGDGSNAVGANTSISSGAQGGVALFPPFAGRAVGAYVWLANSASRGDIQFKLYRQSAYDTVIASSNVIDDDQTRLTSDQGFYIYYFTTPIDLGLDESLYLMVEASTAAVNMRRIEINSGDYEVTPAQDYSYYAYRSGTTGAVSTTATSIPGCGLIYSHIDNGSGMGNAQLNIGL